MKNVSQPLLDYLIYNISCMVDFLKKHICSSDHIKCYAYVFLKGCC